MSISTRRALHHLTYARDILADVMDVEDGTDGPRPDVSMQAHAAIDEAIGWLEQREFVAEHWMVLRLIAYFDDLAKEHARTTEWSKKLLLFTPAEVL